MNTPALEAFLARIYVDPDLRARFLADPRGEAKRAGLTEQQCRALERIDRVGLEMAARSFARKRAGKHAPQRSSSGWSWARNILAGVNLAQRLRSLRGRG